MIKFEYGGTAGLGRRFERVFAPDALAAEKANRMLEDGTGEGAGFLGWVSLPAALTDEVLDGIEAAGSRLRALADVVVVIGIGGSYLGAKAVMEALGDPFGYMKGAAGPEVIFAGQNISEDYMWSLLEAVRGRSLAAIVISKSGTTTEPAIAFRIVRGEIERRYGREGARERIVAVTDASKGALRGEADREGYETFVIPDDVGGRYSVLTPVGLLPLAVAGADIRALVRGARDMRTACGADVGFADNPAARYAAARNALYARGYKIEILASYEPALGYFGEWWKQLFGESEGKRSRGIFPASVTYTTDLHSMGQYIQEGERIMFETVVSVEHPRHEIVVAREETDSDGLNFVAGKRLHEINRMAEMGVSLAHADGGVPNMRIVLPCVDEYNIGALLYFFERACGISGYMLGINPFDQPGVEAYKKNMFALLGKPGYEKEGHAIAERLERE